MVDSTARFEKEEDGSHSENRDEHVLEQHIDEHRLVRERTCRNLSIPAGERGDAFERVQETGHEQASGGRQ